jgi:preprotein translocase subunit SecD
MRKYQNVTEERCASDDIYPELGFYVGADQATGVFSRELRDGSKTIYVQPSAVLNRQDIEFVKMGKGKFNQTVFHISFTIEGKERLAKLTIDNRDKLMVVAVKDQVLIASNVLRENNAACII